MCLENVRNPADATFFLHLPAIVSFVAGSGRAKPARQMHWIAITVIKKKNK